MSFQNCINGHKLKGFLTEKQARDLNERYEKLYAKYSETMGDGGAAHAAAEHFVRIEQSIIQKKMENDINHALALKTVRSDIEKSAAVIAKEKDTAFKGSKWLHGNPYMRAVRDKLDSVYDRQQSLQREAMISISDTVEQFRSKAGGFKQDVDNFTDVVREAMGFGTGNDAARAYGKSIRETLDKLRGMYEDAGGIMGKIEGYFPVHHEQNLVKQASFEDWSNFLKPLLDRERMVDLDTGMPFDEARLDEVMRGAYDNIRTNGLIDIQQRAKEGLQTFGKGGDVSMRRTQSRFFHFKDPESFLEYNAKFGKGDAGLFDSLIGHINAMARDIALMQKFGPKPSAVFENLKLEMEGRGIVTAAQQATAGMYNVLSGRNSGGTAGPMYKFAQGWLNIKRSAYLGSAPISAISDTFFISLGAKMNGVPAVKTMTQYVKLLNPFDSTDRDVARHLFYVASAAQGSSLQGARFADDAGRGGKTAWLAGLTNRMSGLAAMTDAGRQAPMMIQGAMMAKYAAAKTEWGNLEKGIRQAAEKYGITEKDWRHIMRAQATTHPDMEGTAWLMPENVVALGGDAVEAGRKYGDWMTGLSDLAVNEPRLLTRAITTGAFIGDAKQGSLLRLMAANVFFAKSFPITMIINHTLPALRSASNGRFGHLAAVASGSLVMGGLAIQVRNIVQGKTTEDMDSPKFWKRAFLQGGGAGLFGDFMLADYNRFGQSLGGTLAGPIAGTVESLLKAGDLEGLADGDWSAQSFASDAFKIAARETPGINLWYTRLLVERDILDQVQRSIDPKFDSRMRRLERKMEKDYGQGYWWRRGELLPEAMK